MLQSLNTKQNTHYMKTFVYVSYLKDHKNLFTSQCLFFTEYHVGASERKKKKKKYSWDILKRKILSCMDLLLYEILA